VPEKYTHFSEEEQHSIFGTRNWSVDDPRIQDNIKEIQTYLEEWWNMKYNECDRDQDLEDGLSATNRVIWEHELYQALLQAARTVEERWQQKFHKEFENRFNDDLVKFLRKGRSKKS
jgi:hypothetical protein